MTFRQAGAAAAGFDGKGKKRPYALPHPDVVDHWQKRCLALSAVQPRVES
jgi:hypothetical protein